MNLRVFSRHNWDSTDRRASIKILGHTAMKSFQRVAALTERNYIHKHFVIVLSLILS